MQRTVLDTLQTMGFSSDQLSTANFNLRPDYASPVNHGEPPSVTGYFGSNTVQVTLNETERVAQVIDAALAKAANSAYGLYFTFSDPAPARREAIADAIAKARGDAEALARAAGGSLGRILELSTPPGVGETRIYALAGFERGVAGGTVTPIEPGQAVTAAATVRCEFVRGSGGGSGR